MPEPKKVLVIDDEHQIMSPLWFHLTRGGFDLDFAATWEEAKQKYQTYLYDMIAIDALLKRDFMKSGNSGYDRAPSGIEIYRELRRDIYAHSIPLVVLTNNIERISGYRLEEGDPYVKIIYKGMQSAALVQSMHDVLEAAQRIPEEEERRAANFLPGAVPPTESWANLFPLFVQNARPIQRIMVQFLPANSEEVDTARLWDVEEEWKFQTEFEEVLSEEARRGEVLLMRPRQNMQHTPLGLIYISQQTGATPWNTLAFFETAPRYQRHAQSRLRSGCGLALTARFILECLWRRDIYPHDYLRGQGSLELKDTWVRTVGHGGDFLEWLKFEPVPGHDGLMQASDAVCRDILTRASHSPLHHKL